MSEERATYTAAEVCQLLDISDGLLRALMRGASPPFGERRLGTAVRYSKAEVDAYLGRDGDGDAERRRRLLAHGEALLAAVATQLTAVAAAQAGLAELQGAVGRLLAELAPVPVVPPASSVQRQAPVMEVPQRPTPEPPRRIGVGLAKRGTVAAGDRRGPRPPNGVRAGRA